MAPSASLPPPVGAPPEPVPVDLAAVKNAFSNAGSVRFLDLSGRFTLDDRAKITAAAESLSQKSGGKVWVLALPGKTDVNGFAPIHKDLHMGPRDVLFIFNGDRRHLQTVTKSVGNDVLKITNKEFYKSQVQGTVAMMDELAKQLATAAPATTSTTVATPPPKASRGAVPGELVILVPVAIAVLAWYALRNTKAKPVPVARTAKPKPEEPETKSADEEPKSEERDDAEDAKGA